MTDESFPPIFATNRPQRGESVAGAVNRLLSGVREEYRNPADLLLATAYINPQGWVLIADEVEQVGRVRLLIGAVPDEGQRRRIESGEKIPFGPVAEHHFGDLLNERDMVGFTEEGDSNSKRFVRWLRSHDESGAPRVEVRRLTTAFLHGKAFIVDHPKLPAVLSGSSNLTLAGLKWNRELNLGYPQDVRTDLVREWFEEQWEEAEPFDLAAIFEERWLPHKPETIFYRMLYEMYGEDPTSGSDEGRSGATEFQKDGIVRAHRILESLDGVLVCDEVGLGKTFIAGDIVYHFSRRNKQKVLIVVPAALKDSTWTPFLKRQDLISSRVEVVTYDELRLGNLSAVKENVLDDYALVVVDEAHNLRNLGTQRAEALLRVTRSENPTKLLLLTATPVNNSLRDLQSLLEYFIRNDSQFSAIGIPSIKGYIKEAESRDPDTLSPEHLFDLMDRVAVRRTRRFIKTHYKNDTILNNFGEPVTIEFPHTEITRLDYTLDDATEDLVGEVVDSLRVKDDEQLAIRSDRHAVGSRLTMARYAPSLYLKSEDLDAQNAQLTNAGLLRSTLLKRMESSTTAFARTLEKLLGSHKAFLDAIDKGYILRGDALADFRKADDEKIDGFLAAVEDKYDERGQVDRVERYDIKALKKDVEHDMETLGRLHGLTTVRRIEDTDTKLQILLEQLEQFASDADRPLDDSLTPSERRKVIVFSTYFDTVEQIHKDLKNAIDEASEDSPLAAYKGRIAPYVGGSGSKADDRADTLAKFCPKTAGPLTAEGKPISGDEYDILVTTDVLSEGVNLQQAGRIVNYDLPWNPMRLVQRHGRIDRIGSPHRRIHIGCFFPAENLEDLLKLEEALQRKIAYANAAVGAGEVIPGQRADSSIEVLHHDVRKDIDLIRDENPILFERGGGNEALSGEEYRRRLNQKLKTQERQNILGLPLGSGSGFVSSTVKQAGYVFCAKISDHKTPWFRFVAVDQDTWQPLEVNNAPWVDNDTLTCLIAADPGDLPRENALPEQATAQVFGAWRAAQEHIHEGWTQLTDPMAIEPKLEKAIREAINVIEGEKSLNEKEKDLLAATLKGGWDTAIVRQIREALRTHDTREEKVDAIKEVIRQNGLRPAPKPEPLPPVRKEDIRAVCWMAVIPQDDKNGGEQ
jgi:hypothetical protein